MNGTQQITSIPQKKGCCCARHVPPGRDGYAVMKQEGPGEFDVHCGSQLCVTGKPSACSQIGSEPMDRRFLSLSRHTFKLSLY